MKRIFGTALLTGLVMVGLSGCRQDEPTMAPVPQELPDRPALNSVPDDARYVATSAGMGGFTYPLVERQAYYVVDLDADRVLAEGVAERDGDLELKEGKVMLNSRTIFEGEAEGGRRIGLFVKRNLQQDRD